MTLTLPVEPGPLITARLRVVPATADLARAEVEDPDLFGRLLSAEVPANWPPEEAADALDWFLKELEKGPGRVGWLGWYAVAVNAEGEGPVLVGGGGFFGPPEKGAVEIGYSVLPQFYNRGYATEYMGALVAWALAHPEVTLVAAEAVATNAASFRVLTKLGFRQTGAGRDPGSLRFERQR